MTIRLVIFNLLFSAIYSQLSLTTQYTTTDGLQVYLIYSSSAYYYASLGGDEKTLSGTLYLFLTDTKTYIDSNNGVFVGIGFGVNQMNGADMVVCQYKTNNLYTCNDYWGVGHNIETDRQLQGIENVKIGYSNIQSLDSSYAPYKTLVTWNFTKDLVNQDFYDWKDFPNWRTNNGAVIGSWGRNDNNFYVIQHVEHSPTNLTLIDGVGVPSIPLPTQNTTGSSTISTNAKFSKIDCFILIILLVCFV